MPADVGLMPIFAHALIPVLGKTGQFWEPDRDNAYCISTGYAWHIDCPIRGNPPAMKKVVSKITDEVNVSAKGLIMAFLAGCSLAIMTYFFW
jgi:hypothetical protein